MKCCGKSFLYFWILLLIASPAWVSAQDYPSVKRLFECQSITQLTQTFEVAGTKSNTLESMMRSIQRDNLDSGFEGQILKKLAERPWRSTTIDDLDAEFQIIKGQFKAKIILEEEARRRFACELAKFLQRDYLLNFDKEAIFSPESKPFEFYTYVREKKLWRNLLETDGSSTLDTETTPPITQPGPRNNERIVQPKKSNGLTLLNLIYWSFIIIGVWLLISILLGLLTQDRRFTNPSTQQLMEVLLLPYKFLLPFIKLPKIGNEVPENPTPKSNSFGHTIPKENLQNIVSTPIQPVAENVKVPEQSPEDKNRIYELEQQVAKLIQQKAPAPQESPNLEVQELKNDIQQLSLQMSSLVKQIERLKQSNRPSDTPKIDQAVIAQMVQKEINRRAQQDPEPDDEKPIPDFQPSVEEDKPVSIEFDTPAAATDDPEERLELNPIPSTQKLVWYASSPQKGLFYGRRLEAGFVARQTVYKITVDAYDPNRATFTLVDDDDTIRLALNIPDSYIAPAMELRGDGKISDSREIGPIEAGLLQKDGDNWLIVKKGILHYH